VSSDPENDCIFPPCPVAVLVPQEAAVPQEETKEAVVLQEEGVSDGKLSLADSIASLMADRPKNTPVPTRRPTREPTPGPTAEKRIPCAKDLRECPETGNYVGRNPHNECKFLPCPAPEPMETMAASVSSNHGQDAPLWANDPEPMETMAASISSNHGQDAPLSANDDHVAGCTKDLRECPGTGKYVGRNPHNGCRFLECPALEPMESMAEIVHGKYNSHITERPTQRPTQRISCPHDRNPCSDSTSVGRNPKNSCRFFECINSKESGMNPMSEVTDANYVGGGSDHKDKKKRSWHSR